MPGKPSFLRDPDQGAELAALLRDTADMLDASSDRAEMNRSELARHEQAIARYRRWAAELAADPDALDAQAFGAVHIRPATRDAEEATG